MSRNSKNWVPLRRHGPGAVVILWICVCSANQDLSDPTSTSPDITPDLKQNPTWEDVTYTETGFIPPTTPVSDPPSMVPTMVEDLDTFAGRRDRANPTLDQPINGNYTPPMTDTGYIGHTKLPVASAIGTVENHNITSFTPILSTLKTKPTDTTWSMETLNAENMDQPTLKLTIHTDKVMEETAQKHKDIVFVCALVLFIVVGLISGAAGFYQAKLDGENSQRFASNQWNLHSLNPIENEILHHSQYTNCSDPLLLSQG